MVAALSSSLLVLLLVLLVLLPGPTNAVGAAHDLNARTAPASTMPAKQVLLRGRKQQREDDHDHRSHRHLNVFSLYTLPPFSVSFWANEPPSRLFSVRTAFLQVTKKYLEDFIRASLYDSPLKDLAYVDLDVSLKLLEDDNSRRSLQSSAGKVPFFAEVYGDAAFTEPTDPDDRVAEEDAHAILEGLLREAFDAKHIVSYQASLQTSENPILQTVSILTVDPEYQPDSLLRNDPNGSGNNSADAGGNGGSNNGWTTAEYTLMCLLILFLSISSATLVFLIRADRRKLRYGDAPEYIDVARNLPSGTLQSSSDPNQNGSGGQEDVVPVAVEDNQRRYVTPSSPLDMLYGASYLHQEYRKYMKRGSGRSSRSRNRHTPVHRIRPMLQISEEEPEDEMDLAGSSGHNHNNGNENINGDGSNGIGSWLRSLTTQMDCTKEEATLNQDHPFVYRDFPRHDGTPCVIFNEGNRSAHSDGNDMNHESSISPTNRSIGSNDSGVLMSAMPTNIDMSVVQASSLLSTSSHSAAGLGSSRHSMASATSTTSIDNFVDKLETLMAMKHKQYEERARMEQERLERKRQRDLKRRQQQQPQPQPQPQPQQLPPRTPTTTTGAGTVGSTSFAESPPISPPSVPAATPKDTVSPTTVSEPPEVSIPGDDNNAAGVYT